MPLQRRLIDRARRNGAANSFDAGTALAQHVINLSFRTPGRRHYKKVRVDTARARRLVNVSDLRRAPIYVLNSVRGKDLDFRLADASAKPRCRAPRSLHAPSPGIRSLDACRKHR